jgi:hypothetical protein
MKEKFILPANNTLGFEFTSPFKSAADMGTDRRPPSRGEHTESFLKQNGIEPELITLSLQKGRKSKL